MCKVLNTPPDWVVKIFEMIVGKPGTVNSFNLMPFAPTKGSFPELSFKDKHKMALATSVPTSFGRKPRLATARELLVSHLSVRNIAPNKGYIVSYYAVLRDFVKECHKANFSFSS